MNSTFQDVSREMFKDPTQPTRKTTVWWSPVESRVHLDRIHNAPSQEAVTSLHHLTGSGPYTIGARPFYHIQLFNRNS